MKYFFHVMYCSLEALPPEKWKPACTSVFPCYCAAEFLYWLVGENREPELPGLSTCPTRQHLLDNCFHEQDEVSLETLRLFEVGFDDTGH
jgi:hypothetical protein